MTQALTITADLAQTNNLLAVIRRAPRSLGQAWDAVGFAIRERSLGLFRDQQGYTGQPWERLKPGTLARRRGSSAQILVDTGDLRASVDYKADNDGVTIGSAKVQAATHQFGRGAIPRRAFLPIDAAGNSDLPEPWEREVVEIVEAELSAVIE